MNPQDKIIGLNGLEAVCKRARSHGNTVVLTSGCFDLLHGGHLEYLCAAAKLGYLVVGINSDVFVKTLKGKGRPVRDQEDRAFVVAGFSSVEIVTIFDCDYALINTVMPNIYIAYSTSHISIWSDEKRVSLLDKIGARIVELGSAKRDSTTDIIKRAKIAA